MHVSQPGRELTASSLGMAGNTQTRISDLATVAYFVGGTATGILQHASAGPGLARLEGDRLALSMADKQSNVAALAARTQILATEVTALRFRYFDGFEWRSNWDSKVMSGLPKMIEVELQLRPSSSGANQAAASNAANTYQLFIALPMAKPIDTSTMQ